MNVLITSAARKVWLVREFQAAIAPRGGRVVACDGDPRAAALFAADEGLVSPPLDGADFLPFLHEVCASRRIALIVPTRDGELAWFAEQRGDLARRGATVMVSAPEAVRICRDKGIFVDHCLGHGLAVPHTYRPGEEVSGFPVFVKPRFGSGGAGAGPARDARSLEEMLARVGDALIQAHLDLPEYTLDACADFSGRVLSIIPRERVKVIAGESVVGRTVEAPTLVEAGRRMMESLGLVGHATIQCFWDGGEPLFIEVNPRFGGGAALGFRAGFSSPAALVRLLAGESVAPSLGEYRSDLFMFRHSQDIYVDGADVRRLRPWGLEP